MTSKIQSIFTIATIVFASSVFGQSYSGQDLGQSSQEEMTKESMHQMAVSCIGERPCYPRELREKGITGKALVRVELDESGRPAKTVVLSATHPLFAASALRSVAKLDFSDFAKSKALLIPFSYEMESLASL